MEHWLTKRASLSPNAIAVETIDNGTWTFADLYDASIVFAKKLYTTSKTNKHIGILSTNSIEMIVAFFACTYLHKPVVFLNARLTQEELAIQCASADIDSVLYSDTCEALTLTLPVPCYAFSTIKQLKETNIRLDETIALDDICSMMFTSGTTGKAKAVMHTYDNHWASAIASALNLGISSTDKWLVCLPIFHIGGLSTVIKSMIYGMPILLVEKFDETIVHQAIMERNVSIVSVVAVTCSRLLNKITNETYPSTFRCMLLGGGPAPKALLDKAANYHVPIIQTYGMTETSSQIATLNHADAIRKLGSAGKALFSAEVRVNAQRPKEVGEILVKGPMVSKGYYKQPEATERAQMDGWFRTGDLGYIDEEGFLYVVDRRSDLIISGGENIYPAEIENILLAIPGVEEAGVVGVDDAQWGKVPVAFIVTSTHVKEEELLQFCHQRLAKFKIPKHIFFTDTLPRNATNKLQRHKLMERLP
jgi:o-succinylbenzoate---CoA ligase